MGKALRGSAQDGRGGRRALSARLRRAALRRALALILCHALVVVTGAAPARAQSAPERLDRGRFTFVFFPRDRQLATSLAASALAADTFPGLPRPQQRVTIAIAPDQDRFREWAGNAPEWGSAVAFPESRRIVLQGSRAGSDAGDPLVVFRHELAHLALHERLGNLPPRWFDEGYASYAAGEWGRQDVLATNLVLALKGMPSLDELEDSFSGGATAAQSAYALAHRAVAELASIDRERGLALFFEYWKAEESLERGMRRAYGLTVADFEKRWRQRTRRQYGVLAFVGNLTLIGLLLTFVLMPLYLARRRRDRARLERMKAQEEAMEAAARQSAIDELLGGP